MGGAFGERSEPTRPKQLRSERSEQAVAGVWGRIRVQGAEPLAGFFSTRAFQTIFGNREFKQKAIIIGMIYISISKTIVSNH